MQREQRIDVQQQPEQRVDDVLSEFMAPYIHDATKLTPFLKKRRNAQYRRWLDRHAAVCAVGYGENPVRRLERA